MGEPDKSVKSIYEFASVLTAAIAAVAFIFTFLFKISIVTGDSMSDTLHDMDRVLITAVNRAPERGDIVVISQPNAFHEVLIKRVIATGGQTVNIDTAGNTVIVDGRVLDEPYIREPTRLAGDQSYPLAVPAGYVFVMGDNRNNSTDSRFSAVGLIDERYILGTAFYRLGGGTLPKTGE